MKSVWAQRQWKGGVILLCLCALSACGDGGTSSVSTYPPPAAPLTATSSTFLQAPKPSAAPDSKPCADACCCTEVPKNEHPPCLNDAQFGKLRQLIAWLGWNVADWEAMVAARRLTVLAPTDAAFDALARELTGRPDAVFDELLQPLHAPFWQALLDYHLLGAPISAGTLAQAAQVYTVLPGGGALTVQGPMSTSRQADQISFLDGQARRVAVLQADGALGEGLMHAVDRVLVPRSLCFIGQPYFGSGDPRRVFASWAPEPFCSRPAGVSATPIPPTYWVPR